MTPAAVIAPFIAAKQGYEVANQLAAQLAKVGLSAVQRGVEGAEQAYRCALRVRLIAAPLALWIGGWPAILLIALGHHAIMAYCRLMEEAEYAAHARASAASDVVWACLIGIALALDTSGVWWLFAARYAQQLTYYVFARK